MRNFEAPTKKNNTMTTTDLPFRATTEQACDWLASQTEAPWTLTSMIENGLTPYVWLDYDASFPELFGDANGGYAAPIFFEGDTRRLAAGSDDVMITMTKDVYKIVAQLKPPGFRRALHELRFLKKDLERFVAKLKREKATADEPGDTSVASKESAPPAGISKEQVLIAFSGLVKIDWNKALDGGGGIFGDEGARVAGSAKKGKSKTLWHPVTLAFGLNDTYRVPIPHLRKTFNTHECLFPWSDQWQQSLTLLGK
jgi:hypothetical protein